MNRQEFSEAVEPLREAMLRTARLVVQDPSEAEDVVQEVLMRVWNKVRGEEQEQEIDNLQGYCMTATRNLAIDRVKATRKHPTDTLEGQSEWASDAPTPLQVINAKETQRVIQRALAKLPEIQRNILALREAQEMSYDEIADTLGISMSQVKVYLMRARTKIREALCKTYRNS